MRGIKSVALLCTLALGAPAFSAGLTKTLPGDLTTAQAQAVVQASMKKAREIRVPMNIAVMDAGGNLKEPSFRLPSTNLLAVRQLAVRLGRQSKRQKPALQVIE